MTLDEKRKLVEKISDVERLILLTDDKGCQALYGLSKEEVVLNLLAQAKEFAYTIN